MADEKKAAGQEGASPEEDAGKKGSKPFLVIPLFAVVYAGMMFAGWFLTDSVIAPKISASLIEKEKEILLAGSENDPQIFEVGEIHVIEDLVVNPAESGGSRYVAASVAFEVVDPDMIPVMELRDPQIKDFLIRILGSRTVAELADVRTREQLREEIKFEIEKTLGEGSIKAVYFVSFVLQ